MTWTRLDDDWADVADELELSHEAELFHIRALVICNKSGSDGRLSVRTLAKLSAVFDDVPKLIEELVDKMGWIDNGDGTFQVPWDSQEKAETVSKRKRDNAERNRKFRARGEEMRRDRSRNASQEPKASDQQSNNHDASRDVSDDVSRDTTPYLTVPYRPKDGKREREEEVSREVVAPLDSAPGGAPSLTPTQEDDSELVESAPAKPRKPRREPKVVMTL